MSTAWIIVIIAVLLVFFAIAIYNGLVTARKLVDNAWSQIDVQLKRRCDLIPNLLEAVKGYAKHESGVFEKVTAARSGALQAANTSDKIAAENALGGALKGLMITVEAYPDLKANQNFLTLQEELSSTENKISFARQFYNDIATNYNTKIAVFPACVFASMFNFKDVTLWQIENAADRAVPQVKF